MSFIDLAEWETATPDHIEYWYDRHQKLWIIQVIDTDGFEYINGSYELENHTFHGSVKDKAIEDLKQEYGIDKVIRV